MLRFQYSMYIICPQVCGQLTFNAHMWFTSQTVGRNLEACSCLGCLCIRAMVTQELTGSGLLIRSSKALCSWVLLMGSHSELWPLLGYVKKQISLCCNLYAFVFYSIIISLKAPKPLYTTRKPWRQQFAKSGRTRAACTESWPRLYLIPLGGSRTIGTNPKSHI